MSNWSINSYNRNKTFMLRHPLCNVSLANVKFAAHWGLNLLELRCTWLWPFKTHKLSFIVHNVNNAATLYNSEGASWDHPKQTRRNCIPIIRHKDRLDCLLLGVQICNYNVLFAQIFLCAIVVGVLVTCSTNLVR